MQYAGCRNCGVLDHLLGCGKTVEGVGHPSSAPISNIPKGTDRLRKSGRHKAGRKASCFIGQPGVAAGRIARRQKYKVSIFVTKPGDF
jgi:hypothetical protein